MSGFRVSGGSARGVVGKIVFSAFGLLFAFMGTLFVRQEWRGLKEVQAMQSWTRVPCVITRSETKDQGDDFQLEIEYAYTVDGVEYLGDRHGKKKRFTSDAIREIKAVEKQLAVGARKTCWHDPERPADSVLKLPTVKGARTSLGFTLIFPAVGLLFASIPWLGGRKKKETERVARPTPTRRGRAAPLLFGAVFAVAGLAMLKPLLITPIQKTRDAKTWNEIPAVVVSSKVRSHTDDDGTTYSPYIAYRYEVGNEEYFGDQYSFMGGSSSGYENKAKIVRNYPKGHRFTLYVNPADPFESVIKREAGASLLLGLFPLVFIAVGGAVMIAGLRHKKPALDTAQRRERVVELKQPRRGKKLFGLLIFTAIWGGVVYFLIISTAPLLFPIVFGGVELILLGCVIHSTLALFNPRPTVEITPGEIHPGTNVAARWTLHGRVERVKSLHITARCQRVMTTRGSDGKSSVSKSAIHEEELLNADRQNDIARGALQFIVPEDQPASRPGNEDGIEWSLVFRGDIPRWPDMKTELPFIVYPAEK